MSPAFIIRGKRVLLPEGLRSASIVVRAGIIAAIRDYEYRDPDSDVDVLDAGDAIILPGVVDTHVHLNDPGREHWEGFETGTRAAAAGGITTVVDMPLNSVPATTTVQRFLQKLEAADGHLWVDVGFWGGVVPGNVEDLKPLLAEGVLGFKCFLVHSGVDEFPHVDQETLRLAAPVLAASGAPLLAHAELPGPIEAAMNSAVVKDGDPREYATYLASRPKEAEDQAIRLLIDMSETFGTRVHIVHLSSSAILNELRAARSKLLPLSVETCPHYLVFDSEGISDGATQYKCAPPIRENENRQALWGALQEGLIDLVASDHSPCPPEMKEAQTGDYFKAWGGIASLQFSLAALWTEASARGIALERVSEWMSAAPAKLAGLEGRKGSITIGADADVVFFHPERGLDSTRPIHHRHKVTPYREHPLKGVVERTILRGRTVYANDAFADAAFGRPILGALKVLHDASTEESVRQFLRVCGSRRWAEEMAAARPFSGLEEMINTADAIWQKLDAPDLLEAFQAHPRIGQKGGSAWAKKEQAGMSAASNDVQQEMARLNEEYFNKFGFIFIICATGKSSEEMLGSLWERVQNTGEIELGNAAEQQRLITHIRLRKWIAP